MPLSLLAALLAAAAWAAPARPKAVSFKTDDGWTLSARWLDAGRKAPALVLAHGVGSAGGEWGRLADALQLRGISTLCLDLRGHGDSRKGPRGESGPERFDAEREWTRAHEDLHAAARWLERKGVKAERVGLGGASMGANLASRAAAERPRTPCVLLLSAALDYRGVAPTLRPGLRTLAVAAPPDRYAYSALARLGRTPGVETLEAPSGHGVQTFDDPATFDRIVEWAAAACGARP